MKVIACLDQPGVVEKFLRAAGLWSEEPSSAPRPERSETAPEDCGPTPFDDTWHDDPAPDPPSPLD